jgi:threonine dehydrogenase-like Zn-dependent dehydrogenase
VTTYGSQEEPGVFSFKEALTLIHEKKIDVSPLLSHRFPIEDINKAMDVAHNPVEDQALKVSVHFD